MLQRGGDNLPLSTMERVMMIVSVVLAYILSSAVVLGEMVGEVEVTWHPVRSKARPANQCMMANAIEGE
jgi:hypothetical protein